MSSTRRESDDIDQMMTDLLALMGAHEGNGLDGTMRGRLLANADRIREIAQACVHTREYASHNAPITERFRAAMDATEEPADNLMFAWNWMMRMITSAHEISTVHVATRVIMPIVARYLPDNKSGSLTVH